MLAGPPRPSGFARRPCTLRRPQSPIDATRRGSGGRSRAPISLPTIRLRPWRWEPPARTRRLRKESIILSSAEEAMAGPPGGRGSASGANCGGEQGEEQFVEHGEGASRPNAAAGRVLAWSAWRGAASGPNPASRPQKLSPELRAKIASATKAAMQRADVRERMMQGVKVRLHSDETRQKISLAVKKAARRKKEEMGILDPNSEESKPKPKRKAVKATKTATAAAPEPQALPQAALSGAAALSQGEAGAPAPIGEAPRAGKTTRKATTARASRAKSEPRSAEGAGGVRKGVSGSRRCW